MRKAKKPPSSIVARASRSSRAPSRPAPQSPTPSTRHQTLLTMGKKDETPEQRAARKAKGTFAFIVVIERSHSVMVFKDLEVWFKDLRARCGRERSE